VRRGESSGSAEGQGRGRRSENVGSAWSELGHAALSAFEHEGVPARLACIVCRCLGCERALIVRAGADGPTTLGDSGGPALPGEPPRPLPDPLAPAGLERLGIEGPPGREGQLELWLVGLRRDTVPALIDAAVSTTALLGRAIEREAVQHELEREREETREALGRTELLAEASRTLAGSLDYEDTLARVARLALPTLADWSIVDLAEDAGLRRVAVSHADATKATLADELRTRYPLDPAWPEGIARVLRSGRTELSSPLPEGMLAAIARDAEHLRLLEALGCRSAVCVPLIARGRLLGGITLIYGDSRRQYRPTDVPVLEDLGRRAAVAIDNARLYAEAQQSVQQRNEFLWIASHELRTPVTALRLAVQGIARLATRRARAPSVSAEALETAVDVTLRQSDRLARIVDTLLDVSRMETGRLELNLEDVDLTAIVRDAVTEHRVALEHAGCTVELVLPSPVVGRWDRRRLAQVAQSLLSNAEKYAAGSAVRVEVVAVGGLARLTVEDGGIGVPDDMRTRIFDRFERAASAAHYPGLGLGLYVVRRVAEALGGTAAVSSRDGRGACFRVELPRSGPPPDPPGPLSEDE
jgi:signal transduction histidine kinase